MKMMRSATLRANPISWVTINHGHAALGELTITRTSPTISGSSSEVGSSNSMVFGFMQSEAQSRRAADDLRTADRLFERNMDGMQEHARGGFRLGLADAAPSSASVQFSSTVRCGNKFWADRNRRHIFMHFG